MFNRQIIFNKSASPRIQFTNIEGGGACFENMFAFIQKNTRLKESLNSRSLDDGSVKSVERAIRQADWRNPIFNDPDSLTSTLFLIQQEKLPFVAGMNAYFFQLAILNMVGIKGVDVCVRRIMHRNKLTKLADSYLEDVKYQADQFNLNPDLADDIEAYVRQLSKQERYFIQFVYDEVTESGLDPILSAEQSIDVVSANMLFVSRWRNKVDNRIYVTIPSLSLISHLHEKFFKNPLLMMPCFGSVGPGTLEELHRAGVHPVNFYHPDVRSGLKEVHGFPENYFMIAFHDILHAEMGSMLNIDIRNYLFRELVPFFRDFDPAKIDGDPKMLLENFDFVYQRLIDLDLTSINNYKTPYSRSAIYIARAIRYLPSEFLGRELYNLTSKIVNAVERHQSVDANDCMKFSLKLLAFTSRFKTPSVSTHSIYQKSDNENIDDNKTLKNRKRQ